MQGKTKIILNRPAQWQNRMRSYRVLIDGVESGTIRNGSAEEFPLEAGGHRIQCKFAWYSSPEFNLTAEEGRIEYLVVKSGIRYYWPVVAVLFAGLLANQWASRVMAERSPGIFILQLVLIVPSLLYLLYFMTFGRSRCLLIEEDKDNVFAS